MSNTQIKSSPKTTQKADKAVSPVDLLLGLADHDMQKVNDLIMQNMQSPVGMIPDLADHLVSAGGKRLRPLLTLASAHLCATPDHACGENHHRMAAAVEFIHSATLLHDDVVDLSDQRRGRTVANQIWGNAPSILVGDFLFARAFCLMVDAGSMRALGVLSTASGVIAEGEVQQLAALHDIDMSEAVYFDVIKAKTAALFCAACEVSPILSGASESKIAAMNTYGQELGIAFQLVDDILDYGGQQSVLGKSIGDDFREGKITLPVIRAYQHALKNNDKIAMSFWTRTMKDHDQRDVDLENAITLLNQSGALASCQESAQHHVQMAVKALDEFEPSPWRSALSDLANFVVKRLH